MIKIGFSVLVFLSFGTLLKSTLYFSAILSISANAICIIVVFFFNRSMSVGRLVYFPTSISVIIFLIFSFCCSFTAGNLIRSDRNFFALCATPPSASGSVCV